MSFLGWMAFGGALLLTMALSSSWLQRLPVSTAAIYLGIGCIIGPWGLDLLRVDLNDSSTWLERFTEIAVILALFVGGLRLRLPLGDHAWQAAWRLASIVMIVCIAGVALFAWQVLHLDPAVALLLGAILAPTDPVLAGAVTVGHSQDHDHLRYALSGEAGLNDGAAFPFVVLGLLLLQSDVSATDLAGWVGHRLLWAVPAALIGGFLLGRVVGSVAIALRSRSRDTAAPTDFLALALIALSYTGAEAIGAWGFLAVFAAGIGLRRAEISTVQSDPHPEVDERDSTPHPPAETLVSVNTVSEQEMSEPAVAAGVLVAEVFSFGDTMERILEVSLVVLVGVSLAKHWDPRGVLVAIALMFVIRPVATYLLLIGSPTTKLQRGLLGWFGIRGIGSLYYLAYSARRGLDDSDARDLADLTLTVIACSIIAHGLSSQGLMEWYERRLRAKARR